MASLNKVILMGNLTADPELKTTPGGVSVTSFSIGVARRLSAEQRQDPNAIKTDFINIVAWRGTAEFVCNYFSKGKSIVVVGQLQTRSYTAQDGSKRYVTEVVADEVTFGSNAASESGASHKPAQADTPVSDAIKNGTFEEIGDDDDLPF